MLTILRRTGSEFLGFASGATRLLSVPLDYTGMACSWLKLRYVDYEPQPEDIFLVAYPGSGVILLQKMLHELTSGGRDDFGHISERIPWFERIVQLGIDVRAMKPPRIFKSHLPARYIPNGAGRYVYLLRDPRDVVISSYHLHNPDSPDPGPRFERFFERFMRGRVPYGAWVDHVSGWSARRHDPNVLFLQYEHAIADPEGTLRQLAGFCDLDVAERRLSQLALRCNHASLQQQAARYDVSFELLREIGMTPGEFIRSGLVGEGKVWMSPEQSGRLDTACQRRIGMSMREFQTVRVQRRRAGGE